MSYWKPVPYSKKSILKSLGGGVNNSATPFDIKDNELTYSLNMGSQDYPSIGTRYGRTYYSTNMATITTPYALGERSNQTLHVIGGNTWKYWDSSTNAFVNLTTTLTGTYADIQELYTGGARYTIMMNSTQKKIWDGTSTALDLGDASTPFTDIFTIHRGRIFAAKNNTIHYCASYAPNDWTTPDNSGTIILTTSKGNITGITEYNDKIIIFTEYSIHELYGDLPSNFELIDIEGDIGCISNRSIVKCNGKLYWMSNNGIYEYNGASPIKVSNNVDGYTDLISYSDRTKIVAGSNGQLIYVAIPYNSTSNNLILTYDTINKVWYPESGSFVDFVTIQNKLYGLDSTGGIHNMKDLTAYTDNGAAINWEFITKAYSEDTISQKKSLTDINVLYKSSTSATMNVSYSTGDASTSFTALAATSDFDLSNITTSERLIIPSTDLQEVDFYRFKFNGTGKVTINRMEKTFRVKRR